MEVKFGEYLSTFELFEKLIDVGKWVLVLYSLLVEWTVVDTKSVRSILLLDKKNTTTPWRRTWSDETHTFLNIELLLQLLQLFRSKLLRTFANRFRARLKIDDEIIQLAGAEAFLEALLERHIDIHK